MRRGAIARSLVLLLVIITVADCSSPGGAGSGESARAQPRKRIAVIPKGTTHEFWKSVHAGAVKAARELDVEVIWKGPVKEDDRDEQIKVMETFLAQGVDGIVLAPLDDRALAPVVRAAKPRKIPVAIIDSAIDSLDFVSFIATDNERAGALAAERLGTLLGGQGDVVVLRLAEGSASTTAREKGFLETLAAKYPGLRVVSSNRYGGVTTESAYAASENLLSAYASVRGVFCPNESTTFGMLRALDAAGRSGKVRFVGFDASQKLVEALGQGKIDGLVVQNPFRMGELGVHAIVDAMAGRSVEPRVDTGATMVTRDNMNEPPIKILLAPDLATYLN
jgi:ribose transport system substrate-binding protein